MTIGRRDRSNVPQQGARPSNGSIVKRLRLAVVNSFGAMTNSPPTNNKIPNSVSISSKGTTLNFVDVGANTVIESNVKLRYVNTGKGCFIGEGATLEGTKDRRIELHDGAYINPTESTDVGFIDLGYGDYSYLVKDEPAVSDNGEPTFRIIFSVGNVEYTSGPGLPLEKIHEVRNYHLGLYDIDPLAPTVSTSPENPTTGLPDIS